MYIFVCVNTSALRRLLEYDPIWFNWIRLDKKGFGINNSAQDLIKFYGLGYVSFSISNVYSCLFDELTDSSKFTLEFT